MKVLQINAVYGISSTGRTTQELDYAMKEKGIESIIATTRTNSNQDNVYIIGNKKDWKIHSLCSRMLGKQGYFSKSETRKFLEYLKAEKPDIIHLRNLHANYINVPMLLKYIIKNNIPTVITLHDCWFFTGKCCYYTDDGCEKWKKQCGNCPALRKWNKSWIIDKSREMLNEKKALLTAIPRLAVIGVSDWITNEAKQSILKDSWLIKRIYNWIDLDVFMPKDTSKLKKQLNIDGKYVVIGVAQTWSVEKGVLIFQEIARRLSDVIVILIGTLPKKFVMPKNVLSMGNIYDTNILASYYSMADVMINPSIQETFGKTTAEAIACGTPVIGYNLTATPELIGNGCGEIIKRKGDINAFVEAVRRVRKIKKVNYINKCRIFAEKNFNKERLINEYLDLYNKILY